MNKTIFLILIILFLTGSVFIFQYKNKEESIPAIEVNKPTEKQHIFDVDQSVNTELENPNLIILKKKTSIDWWDSTSIYQIWVRSFYDSDGDGNGDLRGIESKLPYIHSLGVKSIWLSPIFESPSYHGYNVTDFRSIEKDFGTIEDFRSLANAAENLGIKLILDFPVNSVSDQHHWFEKALAGDKKYRNYFVWSPSPKEGWGTAWGEEANPTSVWHYKPGHDDFYYGVFGWGNPDLNFYNNDVKSELFDIATYWLENGAGGFRLDAVRYIHEEGPLVGQRDTKDTIKFWEDFSIHVKETKNNALLIGEAFADTDLVSKYHARGKGFDTAFEFNLVTDLHSYYQNVSQNPNGSYKYAKGLKDSYWQNLKVQSSGETPWWYYVSFVNSHDFDRLDTALPQWKKEGAKISASLSILRPGTNVVYYGEEIGMPQPNLGEDVYRRSLMQWNSDSYAGFTKGDNAWLDDNWFPWLEKYDPWFSRYWNDMSPTISNVEKQKEEDDSLLKFYTMLIELKSSDPVISSPSKIERIQNDSSILTLRFENSAGERLVALNISPVTSATVDLSMVENKEYINLFTNENYSSLNGIEIQPGDLYILR